MHHLSTIKNMFNLITYVNPEVKPSRSSIKGHLDAAASASMLASRRIFLAKDCREWNPYQVICMLYAYYKVKDDFF